MRSSGRTTCCRWRTRTPTSFSCDPSVAAPAAEVYGPAEACFSRDSLQLRPYRHHHIASTLPALLQLRRRSSFPGERRVPDHRKAAAVDEETRQERTQAKLDDGRAEWAEAYQNAVQAVARSDPRLSFRCRRRLADLDCRFRICVTRRRSIVAVECTSKPVSRDEVRIFSDHRWNREMGITTGADRCRPRGMGAAGRCRIRRLWDPLLRELGEPTLGHVRNGARAVPTVRAEILARPPQPRPLLLRPLRRPRSQGRVLLRRPKAQREQQPGPVASAEGCGEPLRAARSTKRFCSVRCRVAAFRAGA